jgi:molybdenum cofactor guanylyltransferase
MKTILIATNTNHEWSKFIYNEIVGLLSPCCYNVNKDALHSACYSKEGNKSEVCKLTHNVTEQSVTICQSDHEIEGLIPDLILHPFETGETMLYPDETRCVRLVCGSVLTDNELRVCADKLELPLSIIQKVAWLSGVRVEAVQGVLLAGGRSSRMGTDKASLPLGETTLAESLSGQLNQYCDNLLISIARNKQSPIENVRVVVDKIDGMGPLAGIYSSLTESYSRVSLIVACDIPYIHPMLVRKMFMYCKEYDIVVPSFKADTVEPMMAVYTKACLGAIEFLLDRETLRVKDLFSICKTKVVAWSDSTWYANLNTRDEYEAYCNAQSIKTDYKNMN